MISVVVTTYNRKDLLKETIESILAQTYQNFDLIVVDNYSDYDFFALIESFKFDKIRPYQNHNNGIIAVNRNFGIEKAKGDYIAFCDDDDVWMPDKLEKQVDYLQQHKVDMISTGFVFFNETYVGEPVYRPYKTKLEVYLKSNITPSTVLVKNTIDVRFLEDPSINCAEDWELFAKLITMGYTLYQMPDALVKYRLLSNISNKSKVQPHWRSIKMLYALKRQCGSRFTMRHFFLAVLYHFFFFLLHKLGFVRLVNTLR